MSSQAAVTRMPVDWGIRRLGDLDLEVLPSCRVDQVLLCRARDMRRCRTASKLTLMNRNCTVGR